MANELTRYNEFWFDDGSIIVLAADVAFRLHKGILSRHSTVFRDMFSVAQPVDSGATLDCSLDGVPLVHVSDTREDFESIVSILYDGGVNLREFYSNGLWPLPFSVVSAFLRLGSNYQIDHLRAEAIHRLRICFPTRLSQYKAEAFSNLTSQEAQKHSIPIMMSFSDAIEVIQLAQSFDLADILPSAFYTCAQLPTSQLFDAVSAGRLSLRDLQRIIEAFPRLTRVNKFKLSRLIRRATSPTCHHRNLCRSLMHEIIEGLFDAGPVFDDGVRECFCYDRTWLTTIQASGLCASRNVLQRLGNRKENCGTTWLLCSA
ncbi:unnamed protein product [Somion occarium]|uniref:BTB domain-containing protein n=1 Tax=Somion occarium TaxID=3059160 RepID=A0ABP1EB58_9APHY